MKHLGTPTRSSLRLQSTGWGVYPSFSSNRWKEVLPNPIHVPLGSGCNTAQSCGSACCSTGGSKQDHATGRGYTNTIEETESVQKRISSASRYKQKKRRCSPCVLQGRKFSRSGRCPGLVDKNSKVYLPSSKCQKYVLARPVFKNSRMGPRCGCQNLHSTTIACVIIPRMIGPNIHLGYGYTSFSTYVIRTW